MPVGINDTLHFGTAGNIADSFALSDECNPLVLMAATLALNSGE